MNKAIHPQTLATLKALAENLNAAGDMTGLAKVIAVLEHVWHDHAKAHRFYTHLEMTAPAKAHRR
jgi:hypothetical protein